MRRILAILIVLAGMIGFNLSFSECSLAVDCGGTVLGIPTWYRGLPMDDKCSVKEPANEEELRQRIVKIILNVADMLLRMVGLVSFALILYSGFTYITSVGSAQRVESAKKMLQNAVIGLVIALLATAIVNLIFGMV